MKHLEKYQHQTEWRTNKTQQVLPVQARTKKSQQKRKEQGKDKNQTQT